MACLALTQRFLSGGNRIVGSQQVEVLAPGGFDPGFGVVRGWHLYRQGMHYALAHIETFVGLVELALEGSFFGFGSGQVVLGAQHGEVALRGLQDQVLFSGRQLQCRLFVDRFGSLQLEPAVRAEDRLRQGGAPGIAAAVGGGRGLVQLGAGVHHLGASRQVGQQPGAGLWHHFAAGAVIGAGGGQVGVVVHRFLVDADQVGLHCRGHVRCPDHSVGRTRHGYRQ